MITILRLSIYLEMANSIPQVKKKLHTDGSSWSCVTPLSVTLKGVFVKGARHMSISR